MIEVVLPASLAQVATCQPVDAEYPLREAPHPRTKSGQWKNLVWLCGNALLIIGLLPGTCP